MSLFTEESGECPMIIASEIILLCRYQFPTFETGSHIFARDMAYA